MAFSRNKKALHDYTILETYEAGIVLDGNEVKAIRDSRANLKGSYVRVRNGEMFLIGAHIIDDKDRKLLMKRKEIMKLQAKTDQAGLTLLGLELYQPTTSNKIKLKVAIGKANKDYDKRRILKEKQDKIETSRAMKNY